MTSVCTSRDFQGFRDPYTGEPLQVVLVVSALGVRYQVRGAYSVYTPYKTRSDAVSAWSRVGGVVGLRDPGRGFRCAYTGNMITPFEDSEGHRFSGGFVPEQLRTRDEILTILNKLEGRQYTPVHTPLRVEPVKETAPAPRSHAPDIHEFAEHAAAQVLHDNGVKRNTVSFARTRRGKK